MGSTLSPNKNTRATLSDVARVVGVSKMTVSRVLSGKNSPHEEAIMQAVRDLNFEMNPHAKMLATGRDYGLVAYYVADIDLGVATLKLRMIQSLLTREGYRVPLYSPGAPEHSKQQSYARAMANLRLQRPEAIVGTYPLDSDIFAELSQYQDEGGILVMYGALHHHGMHAPMVLDCDCVFLDEEENSYQAARHLMELGHRQVGFYLDGAEPVLNHPRYQGFMRALQEFGGETRDEWLLHGGDFDSGKLQEGGGLYLAEQFIGWQERPTGMCIVNDNAAVAFIGAVGRAGIRVPEDVSVVGHDDLPVAKVVSVPITTVSHPVNAISEQVTSMLLSRLRDGYAGPARIQVVRGDLIVRESTAPPKR